MNRRAAFGLAAMLGLFWGIHLLGLYTAQRLLEIAEHPPSEPADVRFGLIFVVALLVLTAGMLLAFRWGLSGLVRAVVLLVAASLCWIVLDIHLPSVVTLSGVNIVALAGAIVLLIALYVHPAWYVIDIVGVIIGGGAIALFSLLVGIEAVLVLLVILAIYDAISVYGTKHMLSLAEGALEGRLPVLPIVPLTPTWSVDELSTEGTSDAMVIGLGDAVIPGMLVGVAAVTGVGPALPLGVLTVPALGALIGTGAGLVALHALAHRGGVHAGLPLLNSGAILGYFLASLAIGIGPLEAIGLV